MSIEKVNRSLLVEENTPRANDDHESASKRPPEAEGKIAFHSLGGTAQKLQSQKCCLA